MKRVVNIVIIIAIAKRKIVNTRKRESTKIVKGRKIEIRRKIDIGVAEDIEHHHHAEVEAETDTTSQFSRIIH